MNRFWNEMNNFHSSPLIIDIFMSKSKVTWSYQESGFGKGAPDGFGAIVKRTTENFVKYGGYFDSFEGF